MSLLDDIKNAVAAVEADPLVQVAMDLAVPESTRAALATVLRTVEADVASVRSAAHDESYAQGHADAIRESSPL